MKSAYLILRFNFFWALNRRKKSRQREKGQKRRQNWSQKAYKNVRKNERERERKRRIATIVLIILRWTYKMKDYSIRFSEYFAEQIFVSLLSSRLSSRPHHKVSLFPFFQCVLLCCFFPRVLCGYKITEIL